ncbi:MAG: Fic family protein [Cyanobacteria bacterium TGS_CYA1]|nr:Fic family protein [Cyanobacteria bacterium TGS_CYA1]
MTNPNEKLALSLEVLKQLQDGGKVAIRSADISRTHRERLLVTGFLKEVMKGWYIPFRPEEPEGESTSWCAAYWKFCSDYLAERFGDDWCLSPEQSICLHVGNRTVPKQLVVRSSKGKNNLTALLESSFILDVNSSLPQFGHVKIDNLNVFSLPDALMTCSPNYFHHNSIDVKAALSTLLDSSELLAGLLEGGHSVVAGRLAGAFRNIGRDRIADEILKAMKAGGFDCREEDPFDKAPKIVLNIRNHSPYTNRLKLMWEQMRTPVLKNFKVSPGKALTKTAYLKQVQDIYLTDAYHSLSIEGYKVSQDLIERVRKGSWSPDLRNEDKSLRDALAARGYWLAYQSVRESMTKVLGGANAGVVADDDHSDWYRELFAPSVKIGLLKPADLAGYRKDQVFISRSKYLPPKAENVRDAMPIFFELLQREDEPAVRTVLGHFVFVYIHPYMDGNGRMARFLMNLMLSSGGYPWTVVPVGLRAKYIDALESASVSLDIVPLTKFLAGLVDSTVRSEPKAR